MSGKRINKPFANELYVRPGAAWEKMKAARTTGQTVYIYGATGTGKTSFVMDFLNGKQYCYLSVADTDVAKIAVIVSEKTDLIHEKTHVQKIFVIDDMYLVEAQEDKSACERLIDILSGRKDIWLILISRAPVPKWMKSVCIRNIFVTIGEDALFLTEKEQEDYLEKWDLSPTEAACKKIRKLGYGHPLFLRIVSMRLREITEEEAAGDRVSAELEAIEKSRMDIWDYFDAHVYDQWSVELQEFLMAVSIVEKFDLLLARQITKKRDAGRLILQAQETGNFLVETRKNEQSIYELRSPMKYSMRRLLSARYSQDYINELYFSAGNSYEMEGNLPDALRMYEMCCNEAGISRILIENMRRNPASGDYFELRHYYLTLSEEEIKKSVELMAGMSMLQSMLLNEEESERWYRELKSYAKERQAERKGRRKADFYIWI